MSFGLFPCAKLKKNLKADPEQQGHHVIFGLEMDHWSEQYFLGEKSLISFSLTSWPVSLCRNFKKSLKQIQSNESTMSFMGPKWPVALNDNIFRKTTN